jgi:hypothetical protein
MNIGSAIVATVRLAVPLYLIGVVLGLLPTTVAMLGLVPLAGDRPWRGDLLSPGWMNVVAEMVMNAIYMRGTPEIALVLAAVTIVLPLTLLGQLAAYSFLAGGVLETLRAGPGAGTPFWAACRHWFWPFLRLSLVGGVLVLASGLVGIIVARLFRPIIGPDGMAVLQFAVQAIVLGWLELSRALMVAESKRSVGTALGRAAHLAMRPLVLVLWLIIWLPGAALFVAVLIPPAVSDPYAPLELVRALVFGQVVAFLGAWTKVVRLAIAMRLAVAATPSPRPVSARLAALEGPPSLGASRGAEG